MALLNTEQVAEKYGFSSSQIRRLIRQGLIKAAKVGTYYVIDEKDVRKLKKRRQDNKVKHDQN